MNWSSLFRGDKGAAATVTPPSNATVDTLGTRRPKEGPSNYETSRPDPEPSQTAEIPTDNRRAPGQAPDEGSVRRERLRHRARTTRQRGPTMALPPNFRRIVVKHAKVEILTQAERAKLHDVEARWRAGAALLGRLADDRNRPSRAARRDLEQALDRDTREFLTADAWSNDDIREDASTKISMVKKRLKLVAAEAVPILEPIFARLASAAAVLADGEEKLERDRAERWGVPYVPSAIVRSLKQFSWQVPESLPRAELTSTPPSVLLPEAFEQ